MDLKDRIEKIIEQEKLTPAQFADKIGVQRSNISHIQSARNKPSLDFIYKMIDAFPNLNVEWLMVGTGEMYKSKGTQSHATLTNLFDTVTSDRKSSSVIPPRTVESQIIRKEALKETPKETAVTDNKPLVEKRIEKILVFYSDKTFNEYLPSNTI